MVMIKNRALALFLALVMFLSPSIAFPCGPMLPKAIFTVTSRPDDRYQDFLQGHLGILQPGYRSYDLVSAYRYLIGVGLNPEEQKALLGEPSNSENKQQAQDWVKNWLDSRNHVAGVGSPPEIGWHSAGGGGIYRIETQNGYYSYMNCSDDGFKTAIKTLNDRIQVFGKQSLEIIDWVKAQDIVFSNCSKGHVIPDGVLLSMNAMIKADRAYQIAAANFYSGYFEQAEKMFSDIAEDKTSPWRLIAPYLAARSQIRNASIKGGFGKIDAVLMSRAEMTLQSILQNSSLSRYHQPAEDLLGYVRARLRPVERLHEIALLLSKKDVGPQLKSYLRDYRYMLMNTDREVQKIAMNEDDVTDWVLTFQNEIPDALEHALDRWEKTLSQAWLVAAISKMKAGHPKQQKIQAEATKIKPDSPAYQTAVYHSLRLSIDSGNTDEARRRIDSLLSQGTMFTGSSRNLMLALRMKTSINLDEFLRYAMRVPAVVGYGYGDNIEYSDIKIEQEYAKRNLLDNDSVQILNGFMQLSMLTTVATKTILPEDIRRQVAITAWMRAILLDNGQALKKISPPLSTLVPEMQQLLAEYGAAATNQERQFIASYIILKYPGMKPFIAHGVGRTAPLDKIDNYRDNWWCPLSQEGGPVEIRQRQGKLAVSGAGYPGFLTKEEMEETEKEISSLLKVENAPNYLSAIVLLWADRNRDDPRVPEALHLLVRATRYGCADKQTSVYSKKAFKLLHKRYPENKWTKETPYYF